MRELYAALFPVVALSFSLVKAFAQPTISYSTVATGLSAPVEVANAGDGSRRLFIVQQSGAVRIYDSATNNLLPTPFMNISPRIIYGGERGLLSIAFHPSYATNGYFFAYYNRAGDGNITVSRFKVSASPNVADTSSRVELLTIPKPFDNHNGGHLQFGPDGNLYFATGDGGSGNDPGNRAQDSTVALGKMLRINVDNFDTPPYYTIPSSNPFYNTPNYDKRIWARGLRNPYRWSFDRLTGDMWIGDVGQGTKEEIDYRPGTSTGGENYGWRCFEGSIRTPGITACDAPGYVPPVYDYDNPSNGSSSVIGGYVYRGTEFGALYGYYLAADFYSGNVYLLKPNGSGGFTTTVRTGLQNFIGGFGESEGGSLYAVSQATNTLYKVVVLPPLPVRFVSFTGRRTAEGNELKWTTALGQDTKGFDVEWSGDGLRFSTIGNVAAGGNAYLFVHRQPGAGTSFYRLSNAAQDRQYSYSPVIQLGGEKGGIRIQPTAVKNRTVTIESDYPVTGFQLLNGAGAVVYQKSFASATGYFSVQLPPVPKGIYTAVVTTSAAKAVQKLWVE